MPDRKLPTCARFRKDPGPLASSGIADKPSCAVAGHIEFRDHANASIARVLDQVADFILRVVQAVGTHLMKLRKFLAFNAEALIFREVPVEDVHLHGFESVDVSSQHIERHKMAR